MSNKIINIRVRLVIIKEGKVLLHYTENGNYYFYTGGHLEFGETLEEASIREVKEETRASFTFKKILYIREFILPEENEHSMEFFILGDIDKFEELEGYVDPEGATKGWKSWQNWIDVDKLDDINVKPKALSKLIQADYKAGFTSETKYLGKC